MSHKFVAGGEVGETRSFSLLSLSENLAVEMIHVDELNDKLCHVYWLLPFITVGGSEKVFYIIYMKLNLQKIHSSKNKFAKPSIL